MPAPRLMHSFKRFQQKENMCGMSWASKLDWSKVGGVYYLRMKVDFIYRPTQSFVHLLWIGIAYFPPTFWKQHCRGRVVMIWADIMLNGRLLLYVFKRGIMNTQTDTCGDTRKSFMFMHDNLLSNLWHVLTMFSKAKGYIRMVWVHTLP